MHRLAGVWSRPAHSRLVETNAREHNIRGIGDIDAKDVDQFGDGLPQRLGGPSKQPVGNYYQLQRPQESKHGRVLARKGMCQVRPYHNAATLKSTMVAFSSQSRSR